MTTGLPDYNVPPTEPMFIDKVSLSLKRPPVDVKVDFEVRPFCIDKLCNQIVFYISSEAKSVLITLRGICDFLGCCSR